MRNIARSRGGGPRLRYPLCASAQDATLPVPSNVKVDGVPPIPTALADALAPYGNARQVQLLAWHPTRRQILIATSFGTVPQIHAVAGPGMDRTQLTFFREGLSVTNLAVAYEPSRGDYFVFTKDTGRRRRVAPAVSLRRRHAAGPRCSRTASRTFGTPVWSHKAGLIAFESNRRNGKDRDLYVMNPLDPASLRMVAQTEGSWNVADWSPDDSELLVMNVVTNDEKYLWRVKVKTGEKTPLTAGDKANWVLPQYTPDGKGVYATQQPRG